jgi:tetratricopeptide (TPR) repeat protein
VLGEKLADTEEAWSLYQVLHRENPADRDVTERLARIAGARGETDLAVGFLSELADSAASPSDAARCHRRIAEAWLAVGDDAYASQAYYNALDAQPDDVDALAGLRDIARRAEDWGTLLSVMKRQASLGVGAERAASLREVAELTEAHVAGQGAAVDAWRTAAEADPEDLTAWRRVLDLAEQSGEHEAFLEAAGGVEPRMEGAERSSALRRMGAACEALGRTEDAVHYYEQAVAAEVPNLEAASRLEALYRETYDWAGVSRALAVQARFAEDPEARMAAWLEAARIEREQRHDREAASRLYEEALSVDPDCLTALWFQCIWLFESGRPGEALPLFARVEPRLDEELATGGEDAPIAVASFLYRYAELLRGSGREEEALQRYLGALRHVPVHLPSLEAAGPLLVERRDWERANEVWRMLLQITGGVGDPQKRAQVHTMLGLVDQAEGRSEQAFKRFTRALEAFPNHVPALRGLAAELESREDWNALLSVYNAVIYHATAPQDVIDAYMIKGRVLDEQMGRPDKAVQHYERSLAFEGRQPLACLRLSELALRRGAWDDALSYAARGVDIAAESPSTLAELHLARALALSGLDEYAGAAQAVALARESDPGLDIGDDPLRDPAVAIAALHGRLPR